MSENSVWSICREDLTSLICFPKYHLKILKCLTLAVGITGANRRVDNDLCLGCMWFFPLGQACPIHDPWVRCGPRHL